MILSSYPKTIYINIVNYKLTDSIKFLILEYSTLLDITPPTINIRRLYIIEDRKLTILRINKSLINTQYSHSALGVYYDSKLIITNSNRINCLKLLLL